MPPAWSGQLRSKRNLTRLMQYSAQLYGRLEAETGQATEWKPVGSLRLASSAERWSELKRMATTARSFDFELHTLSPEGSAGEVPADHARRRRRRGVRAQRRLGRALQPHHGLRQGRARGRRAHRRGRAGHRLRVRRPAHHARAHRPGRRSTARSWSMPPASGRATWRRWRACEVPAGAVEHQYMITEKSDAIPKGLPTLRDPDNIFYLKPEPGALAVGGWEQGTPTFGSQRRALQLRPRAVPGQPGPARSRSCCRPPSACRS